MTLADLVALLNFLIVLVFIYLALSLFASQLVEMVASLMQRRGRLLRRRIAEIFDDVEETGFAGLLQRSPLIRSLAGGGRLPSYVPPEGFAQAVVAIIRDHRIAHLDDLPPPLRAIALAEGFDPEDLGPFRAQVESWYDRAMQRLSGAYKRWAQRLLFAAGLLLAVGFNVDLLDISRSIWSNRFALDTVVGDIESLHATFEDRIAAGETVPEILGSDPTAREKLAGILEREGVASAVTLPVGWEIRDPACADGPDAAPSGAACTIDAQLALLWQRVSDTGEWSLAKIVGWILSALLVVPGANFWFDILGRLLALRGSGARPEPAASRRAG